jgi:aconitate hydratase
MEVQKLVDKFVTTKAFEAPRRRRKGDKFWRGIKTKPSLTYA